MKTSKTRLLRGIFNREALYAAAALCAVVVVTGPKPVLSCLRISTDKRKVYVAATNLESSVLVDVDQVQVERQGEVLVNADDIVSVLAKSEDETITLEQTADKLIVRTRSAKHELPTLTASDFPAIPKVPAPDTELASETLGACIKRTLFAAQKGESTRFSFNGLNVALNGKAEFVATDGHRLAIATAGIKAVKPAKALIFPALAAKAVQKACDAAEETTVAKVGLAMKNAKNADKGEGIFGFQIGSVSIVSLAVPGNFPPFRDVIPKDATRTLTAAREPLLAAVTESAALHPNGLRLNLIKGKGVAMSAVNPESGESSVGLVCKIAGSDDLAIGLKPEYLIDGLKATPGDEVTMLFNAPNRPVLIDATDYQYVAMPMNIDAAPMPKITTWKEPPKPEHKVETKDAKVEKGKDPKKDAKAETKGSQPKGKASASPPAAQGKTKGMATAAYLKAKDRKVARKSAKSKPAAREKKKAVLKKTA